MAQKKQLMTREALELAERFMMLFAGSDRAHGVYDIPYGALEAGKGQKVKGRARTLLEAYTVEHWQRHLSGQSALGVIPIMQDNKCVWGAVDIDVYTLDHVEVCKRLAGTPLVPIRTKSGGLHIYLFAQRPVPARVMRLKLKDVAKALGHGGAEIFPKQDALLLEKGDVGNWINMPYFNSLSTTRYGYTEEGEPLSAEDFLEVAYSRRIDAQGFARINAAAGITGTDNEALPDGPPCLQYLCRQGFPQGSRNNALFSLGVYYRKSDPDNWEKKVEEANQRWMTPGTAAEVVQIVKSLKGKSYGYRCTDMPLCDHCNKDVCLGRRFGIGSQDEKDMPTIHDMAKINSKPPLYFITINDTRVGPITSDDLLSQPRFRRICFESLGLVPPSVHPARWRELVQRLSDEANIIEVPDDSSMEGQLLEHLDAFCSGRRGSPNKDDIAMGRVWLEDGKRYYFRMRDFLDYLESNRFRGVQANHIAAIFRQLGFKTAGIKVRGKFLNAWIVDGVVLIRSIPVRMPKEVADEEFV